MPNEFFTWETLNSPASIAFVLFFLVQYTKKLVDRLIPWLPTDILSVIWATTIIVLVQIALGASIFDWKIYALAFFNSFVVAAMSGHIHAKVSSPPNLDKKPIKPKNVKKEDEPV